MPTSTSTEEQERRLLEGRCKLACDECRKRKLRCDGQQPKCGICAETGIPCRVNSKRSARGPKKGLLKALRLKNAELQHRLKEHEAGFDLLATEETHDFRPDTMDDNIAQTPATAIRSPHPPCAVLQQDSQDIGMLSDLTLAELNQLYFERVHPLTPVIQKHRFRSCAQQSNLKSPRLCLQFAMWALAALLSAQYQHISDMLYQHARKRLEKLELQVSWLETIDVEQAQAWLLIAIYEFTRMHYSRGWMSIGRTCRLVQLMGLHKIDCVERMSKDAESIPRSSVETEERRRTFWMAYCLDRFIGIRNDWPIAFNELAICTRLPTSETDFQNGEAIVGKFLSEEIAVDSDHIAPSFTELIVLATIGGRCLAHKQQAVVEPVYGSGSQDFWNRHQWLHSLLLQKVRKVSRTSTASLLATDSMRLFANMVAQTVLIYLCQIMNLSPCEILKEQVMPEYEEEARAAAKEIVNLTQFVDELSIFKFHPFSPYFLYTAGELLIKQESSTAPCESELQTIVAILESMRPVNNLAERYLQLLRLGPPTS